MSALRVAVQAAAILLAGTWIYAPALHGDWLRDDRAEVPDNPELRLPVHELGRVWSAPQGRDYLPLKTTVQWIEWRLWGEDRLGYHGVNVALHLLSALLFWRLLGQLGVGGAGAWLGGLLLAVHPLAVDSVAWISELKNTLSLPLLLAALLSYLAYDRDRRAWAYVLALGLFVASLLAKASGVMLPFVLLLHAWWRRGRIGSRDLRAALPFFGASLLLGAVTVAFQQQRAIVDLALPLGGLGSRLAVAGLALAFYAGKCLAPVGLLPVYPRWPVNPPQAGQFLPWLVLGVLAAWLWRHRNGFGKHACFGLGFFVLNLVPVLGFVSMSYFDTAWVAGHLVYLPLLGLIGLAAAGWSLAWRRLPSPAGRMAAAAVTGLACAGLAADARGYARAFQGEEALWSYELEGYPGSWIAHNDLALALADRGQREQAIGQFEEAARIEPGSFKLHYDFGNTLAHAGRLEDAIGQFREAIRLKPSFPDAHNNLGIALARSGRLEDAVAQFQEALALNPGSADARRNLALAERSLGR